MSVAVKNLPLITFVRISIPCKYAFKNGMVWVSNLKPALLPRLFQLIIFIALLTASISFPPTIVPSDCSTPPVSNNVCSYIALRWAKSECVARSSKYAAAALALLSGNKLNSRLVFPIISSAVNPYPPVTPALLICCIIGESGSLIISV